MEKMDIFLVGLAEYFLLLQKCRNLQLCSKFHPSVHFPDQLYPFRGHRNAWASPDSNWLKANKFYIAGGKKNVFITR